MQVEAFRFSSRSGPNLSCFSALSKLVRSGPCRGPLPPLGRVRSSVFLHSHEAARAPEATLRARRNWKPGPWQNSDDKDNSMRKSKAQAILWAVFRCSSCKALVRLHVLSCHEDKGFCFLSGGDGNSMPTLLGSALGPKAHYYHCTSREVRWLPWEIQAVPRNIWYILRAFLGHRFPWCVWLKWEPNIYCVFRYPLRDSFHDKYH